MGKVIKHEFGQIERYTVDELKQQLDLHIARIEIVNQSVISGMEELQRESILVNKLMRRLKQLT